jgi:hypothetical protein
MGRHRVDDPAVVVIRVRVTRSEHVDLARVARDNQTTVSGVIRESVNEFVSDYRDDPPTFGRIRRTRKVA